MHNILLTLIIFITTLSTEIGFFITQGSSTTVPLRNFIGLFIALLLFSFIKKRMWRLISMNMIIGFSFVQMMHIQFYGVPVYPNAIYLFFVESGEVFDTLFQNFILFLIPFAFIVPGLIINLFADKKITKLKGSNFLHFVFIFYFVFNPMRTYSTGNTWGRQPSTQEFMGTNIYLSLSYFTGRILPHKFSSNKVKNSHKPNTVFSKVKPFEGNIIFVLGESLSANHLSLLGYNRATSPFLDSLKADDNFIYRKGISSGVSTDISVAMMMNNTYGLRGSEDIITGKKCLNRLAKKSNFKTHFYSSQSQQQLRYITNSICLSSIDHYKSLDNIQPNLANPNKANDLKLIDLLPENDLDTFQNFYILHQRGSHSPYKLRYQVKDQIFPITGDYKQDRINHYDNTVYNFDLFMKKLTLKVKNYSKPTIIIYVSDHGEGLGEEGVWGHAALKRPSIEIPVIIYQHKSNLKGLEKLPKNPTHFNISLLLSKLLGFESQDNIFNAPKDFQILGNDIDGFAGYLETEFLNGELRSIKRKDI